MSMQTKTQKAGTDVQYLVPSRTISGSRDQMLEQIDEAIQGLLALRHLIGTTDAPRDPRGIDERRMRLVRSTPQVDDSANR